MRLYSRIVSLLVGPKGEQGLDLSAFRISFEVVKTDQKTTNTAIINIYNLSKDTKAKIERGNRVILGAGHGSVAPVIFVGDIIKVDGSRSVITIEAEDGGISISTSTISKAYEPGTSAKTMIEDIAQSFDVTGVVVPEINETLAAGFAAIGPAAEALTDLSDRFGLNWQIQDDELIVSEKDTPISTEGYLLGYDSGLLDIPQEVSQESGRIGTEKPLYRIQSRLIGKLNPSRLVKIESEFVSGVFRIQKLKHTGDTRGEAYYTELEVIER